MVRIKKGLENRDTCARNSSMPCTIRRMHGTAFREGHRQQIRCTPVEMAMTFRDTSAIGPRPAPRFLAARASTGMDFLVLVVIVLVDLIKNWREAIGERGNLRVRDFVLLGRLQVVVDKTANSLRPQPAMHVELRVPNCLQRAGGDLAHKTENVRTAEMGEPLLLVNVIGQLKRQAGIEGHLLIKHDNASVEISLIERIIMDVRADIPRRGDESPALLIRLPPAQIRAVLHIEERVELGHIIPAHGGDGDALVNAGGTVPDEPIGAPVALAELWGADEQELRDVRADVGAGG